MIPAILEAATRATGLAPASLTIEKREAPSVRCLADGRHLIAKEYLSNVELDALLNEHRALRLVESMDIAPQPLFFDPSVGPVVVYRYLEGTMWDRRVPAAAALAGLADLWVALHALPIADLWIGGGQARNSPTLVPRLRAPIERYAAWAAQSGDGAHPEAGVRAGAGAWIG